MGTLQHMGHLIRQNTAQLQLTEGKIDGKIYRGRLRTTWITDQTHDTNYYEIMRVPADREEIRDMGLNLH